MGKPAKPGDIRSRRESRREPCQIAGHERFGALCLGCALELAHEEADWTREQCAQIAEKMGVTGKFVATQIRAGRPPEYAIPNTRAHGAAP